MKEENTRLSVVDWGFIKHLSLLNNTNHLLYSTLKPETLQKKEKAQQKTAEERAAAKKVRRAVCNQITWSIDQSPILLYNYFILIIFEDEVKPLIMASIYCNVVFQLTIFRDWENILYYLVKWIMEGNYQIEFFNTNYLSILG